MTCSNCGKEMGNDSLYCPNCGSKNERTNEANSRKKRKPVSPMAIFLISFFVTIGISIIVFIILAFNGISVNKSDYANKSNDERGSIIDNANTENITRDKAVYDYKYSYTELPDVLSLDSDTRFIFSAGYTVDGVAVYTYLFNDEKATDADFLWACDDYTMLLQELHGFTYEKEYTEQQYEKTGKFINYLTKDSYSVSITASFENSLSYAYVSIFSLGEEAEIGNPQVGYDMPNYNTYLAGREIKNFNFDETVSMENGLSFIIYDVIGNYPGDGTLTIDVTMDLSSWYADYYLNNGDFMILPADVEGNVLSDAIPISIVKGSDGTNVGLPFLVNASSYESYTFTYVIPSNTSAFSIYASNVVGNNSSDPVYVMDIGY